VLGKQVGNAILNFSKNKILVVRNGKVIRLERKNAALKYLSKKWKTSMDIYHE
jgi:hypothetical protein